VPLLRPPGNAAHQGLRSEHERASDLGDRAIRAVDQGDLGQAREFIEVMARTGAHWKAEENGGFRVMAAREEQYADYAKEEDGLFLRLWSRGWCRVGRLGGGPVRGTSRREDDHGLMEGQSARGRDGPEASRCRSPLARFAGRCIASLMASSEPMRRTCRRARVTAV
jgi:hypothetical protein